MDSVGYSSTECAAVAQPGCPQTMPYCARQASHTEVSVVLPKQAFAPLSHRTREPVGVTHLSVVAGLPWGAEVQGHALTQPWAASCAWMEAQPFPWLGHCASACCRPSQACESSALRLWAVWPISSPAQE